MSLKYMNIAFREAEKAFKVGEVPVGAVIVKNDKIVSKAYNRKEKCNCVICHAEMLAIKKASKKLKNWRLDECDIYVTLDPCPMCASAIKQARIANVFSAVSNNDENNEKIIRKVFDGDLVNSKVNFVNNLDVERGKMLLQNFFVKRRKK